MKMRGLHRIKEIEKPNNSKTLTKALNDERRGGNQGRRSKKKNAMSEEEECAT